MKAFVVYFGSALLHVRVCIARSQSKHHPAALFTFRSKLDFMQALALLEFYFHGKTFSDQFCYFISSYEQETRRKTTGCNDFRLLAWEKAEKFQFLPKLKCCQKKKFEIF